MTDAPNGEWSEWQEAWLDELRPPSQSDIVATLQRKIRRHRQSAWATTALDVLAAVAFCAVAIVALRRSHSLPVLVWTVSIFVFSAALLAFAIWNRRDVLFASGQPTTDFLALLRIRLGRRERVPRLLAVFVAVEIAFGLVFYAVWFPDSLGTAAAVYGVAAGLFLAWWRWAARRLRRERAQLEALAPADG
jgi:membrane associated rhomboid family serine protease